MNKCPKEGKHLTTQYLHEDRCGAPPPSVFEALQTLQTQTSSQSNKGHFKHVFVCIFPYISNSSQ